MRAFADPLLGPVVVNVGSTNHAMSIEAAAVLMGQLQSAIESARLMAPEKLKKCTKCGGWLPATRHEATCFLCRDGAPGGRAA